MSKYSLSSSASTCPLDTESHSVTWIFRIVQTMGKSNQALSRRNTFPSDSTYVRRSERFVLKIFFSTLLGLASHGMRYHADIPPPTTARTIPIRIFFQVFQRRSLAISLSKGICRKLLGKCDFYEFRHGPIRYRRVFPDGNVLTDPYVRETRIYRWRGWSGCGFHSHRNAYRQRYFRFPEGRRIDFLF